MNTFMRRTVLSAVLASLLTGCGRPAEQPANPSESTDRASVSEPPSVSAGRGVVHEVRLVADVPGSVSAELLRLATGFVSYALGSDEPPPHITEVDLLIGGAHVGVTTFADSVTTPRRLTADCPHGGQTYAAAWCPLDFFGPIRAARTNGTDLAYSPGLEPVVCAPDREGALPRRDVIVLRPVAAWRTCATDFAIALLADPQGRLRGIDLTLSEP